MHPLRSLRSAKGREVAGLHSPNDHLEEAALRRVEELSSVPRRHWRGRNRTRITRLEVKRATVTLRAIADDILAPGGRNKDSVYMTDRQSCKTSSLRCLLGAMRGILILEWLTGEGREHTFPLTTNISKLDEVVNNIETFFLKDIVLDKDELRYRYLQLGSSSWQAILHAIFFEAAVHWIAAHRSDINMEKYLDESMYTGEMLKLYRKFAKLPMPPLGYTMVVTTVDDFKEILTHSINLVNNNDKTFDEMKQDFADDDWSFVTQEVDDILSNQTSTDG